MVRILVPCLFTLCFSCANNQHCKPETPQKLFAIRLEDNGSVSYQHNILIEGITKNCDSITVMSAIKSYVENNSSDTPILNVAVFNSTENYDRGETLSQPKEFYGDCVVEVWFDLPTGKPESFSFFYNSDKGKYKGVRWMP